VWFRSQFNNGQLSHYNYYLMKTLPIQHEWNLTPREARALQSRLAAGVIRKSLRRRIRTVAGVDVHIHGHVVRAGAVVLDFPGLNTICQATAEFPVNFPYIPGLLSFREAPVALAAIQRLGTLPDALIVDGQGIAHPRRFGLACHLGLILDIPAIGCAKSRLCGRHGTPAVTRGSRVPLIDTNEIIGTVLRTRTGVRPVYVSIGHRVSLNDAVDIVLACTPVYRLPKTTRLAHRLAGKQ